MVTRTRTVLCYGRVSRVFRPCPRGVLQVLRTRQYVARVGDCWSEVRGSLLEKLLLPLLLRVLPLLMKLRKREAGLVLLTKMKG